MFMSRRNKTLLQALLVCVVPVTGNAFIAVPLFKSAKVGIGELSPFHHTYGYYAQGVDSTTAMLPAGWRKRLILVCNENTNNIRGHCVEIHDLIISKLYAGRQKDIEFFHAAIQLRIITKEILLERLDMTPISDVHKERIQHYVKGGFHNE